MARHSGSNNNNNNHNNENNNTNNGVSGRPNSMNTLCPDEIGCDSWDEGGKESVVRPDRSNNNNDHRSQQQQQTRNNNNNDNLRFAPLKLASPRFASGASWA